MTGWRRPSNVTCHLRSIVGWTFRWNNVQVFEFMVTKPQVHGMSCSTFFNYPMKILCSVVLELLCLKQGEWLGENRSFGNHIPVSAALPLLAFFLGKESRCVFFCESVLPSQQVHQSLSPHVILKPHLCTKGQEPSCKQAKSHQQAIRFDATPRRIDIWQGTGQEHVNGHDQEGCDRMDVAQHLLSNSPSLL